MQDGNPTGWRRTLRSRAGLTVIAVVILAGISAVVASTPGVFHASVGSAGPNMGQTGHALGSSAASTAASTPTDASTTATTPFQTQVKAAMHSPATSGHLVIETANLALTVAKPATIADKITQAVNEQGGFVQSLNELTGSGTATDNLVVRVPEQGFGGFLKAVKGLGTVQSFSQTGQDVTDQHQALVTQLTQLQSEATAFTRLYDKAQAMSDMIQIQQSLSDVNTQILSVNAQLHQINRSVQLATVNITLTTGPVVVNHPANRMWTAFTRSLAGMEKSGTALLVFVAWLLPWSVLAAVAWWVYRFWVKLRKKTTS